jgi:hypothetical protein
MANPGITLSRTPVPAAASSAEPRRTATGAIVFCLGVPLILYHFIMIERKYSFLAERGPFLLSEHLNLLEKGIYILVFPLGIFLLLATASAGLERLGRPLAKKFSWTLAAVPAFCYFALVTSQYQVLQYARDMVTLTVFRSLGGGSLGQALAYVKEEALGLLPPALAALLACAVAGWFLFHANWQLRFFAADGWLASLFRFRVLLAANILMCIVMPALAVISPPLRKALSFTVVEELYIVPADYLTDFDRDGYSLVSQPPDFAPFDRSRHPYALEIPGNGIDEDGIGGDLPAVIRKPQVGPWKAADLQRKNVMLIVLESARADLLDAALNREPVMPTLRNLPGHRIAMFSHAGYTVPSVSAMMTASEFPGEGISLIDRFKSLGYRTGVFSAQAESFGGMAANNRLRDADVVFDANSFPPSSRMYSSAVSAALAVPAGLVNAEFAKWIRQRKSGDPPFFAYINWQEMHFPYYYAGAPKVLLDQPIPRPQIRSENREWLRKTYYNAARLVDNALAQTIALLDEQGIRENTVLLVIGDHGEELFDHGYLGHGTNVSYEQNAALCKLIHSNWTPPSTPLGSTDVTSILHNALVSSSSAAVALGQEALCHVGSVGKPLQIGLFTTHGLERYNFATQTWTRQPQPMADFSRMSSVDHVAHVWESLLIEHAERMAGK